jgi:hypothetical protein
MKRYFLNHLSFCSTASISILPVDQPYCNHQQDLNSSYKKISNEKPEN